MRVLPHGGAQRGQPDGHHGGRGGEDDGELSLVLQLLPFDPDGGEGGGGGGGGTHLGTVHGQLLQVIRDLTLVD